MNLADRIDELKEQLSELEPEFLALGDMLQWTPEQERRYEQLSDQIDDIRDELARVEPECEWEALREARLDRAYGNWLT